MSKPRTSRPNRQVVIRAFEPADAEALARIFQQPSVITGTMRTPHEPVAMNASRFLTENPQRRMLVAAFDERIVGNVTLFLDPTQRRRHTASLAMMVDENFQGRGIGGALLDAGVALAERWMHVHRIELEVHVDNARALALYRSRDFNIEGVARSYSLRDGVLVDAFHMARVSPALPYPRLTAEEAATRQPPALPRSPQPTRRKKSGSDGGGWGSRGGTA